MEYLWKQTTEKWKYLLSAYVGQFIVLGAVAGFIGRGMVFISESYKKENKEWKKMEAMTMI